MLPLPLLANSLLFNILGHRHRIQQPIDLIQNWQMKSKIVAAHTNACMWVSKLLVKFYCDQNENERGKKRNPSIVIISFCCCWIIQLGQVFGLFLFFLCVHIRFKLKAYFFWHMKWISSGNSYQIKFMQSNKQKRALIHIYVQCTSNKYNKMWLGFAVTIVVVVVVLFLFEFDGNKKFK